MSIKNWPGGRISPTPPTPSGPYQNSTASGVWTLDQVAYWEQQNQWPTAGSVNPNLFIENLFQTWLYTGNGSTQTITNGIDLSTNGGLVWIKSRNTGYADHLLFDTARGATKWLTSVTADSEITTATTLTAFNSNGFSLSTYAYVNASSDIFASWTFRKQAKFFDVVTYTGTGTSVNISHNLGSTPGCLIIKRTSGTGNWSVFSRDGTSSSKFTYSYFNTSAGLNLTAAAAATGVAAENLGYITSTTFNANSLSGSGAAGNADNINENGATYVAYLFAHDAGGFGLTGTDNVISCGSFTTNGSGAATVTLNYEPQWLMIKRTNNVGNWILCDSMRGLTVGGIDPILYPNSSTSEDTSADYFSPTATGFTVQNINASATFIYIAIRRGPMKTPTDATKVFTPTVYTGTNVDNRLVNTTIAPDMVWVRQRNDTVLGGMVVGDRLRAQPYLLTGTTAAEVNDANAFDAQVVSATEYGNAFSSMSGFWCGNDATAKLNANTTSNNHIAEAFKRAPGFFDMVCFTGPGTYATVSHNLGVAPQLIIQKRRDGTFLGQWYATVYEIAGTSYPSGKYGILDGTDSFYNGSGSAPTATVFTPTIDASGSTYVTYLFASCPGVSKVGSYTGTGTTKQIDCGFTGGARFVLIKRTDSTGDWYVWDSARGIVAGDDPYLLLNSTAAEVTNTDYVDTYSAGFEISSTAPAAINANGGSFIFLAIA